MFDVEIRTLSPLRIAALRFVGPFTELAPTFERIAGWAGQKGLFQTGAQMIGVFHDDPRETPPDKLRSDAAVTLTESFTGPFDGGVVEAELPGGEHAVGTFRGPYEELHGAYQWLMREWMPAHGVAPGAGASYEIYLNDPTSTPKEDLLTAIHFPVDRI